MISHPMDEVNARAISNWRYDAPYDLYNPNPDNVEEDVQVFLDPQNAYYTITDKHRDLVAYCCFGPGAQVQGGDYNAAALDIGLGMRPDLTGQGHGLTYVNATLNLARRTFMPTAFRVTVAAFNTRALRVWENAGFQPMQTFQRSQDSRAFVVLMREVRSALPQVIWRSCPRWACWSEWGRRSHTDLPRENKACKITASHIIRGGRHA